MPDKCRYIVVELFDSANVDTIAHKIAIKIEEVVKATPASDDGFGHIVLDTKRQRLGKDEARKVFAERTGAKNEWGI
jgi:hypothetical protein